MSVFEAEVFEDLHGRAVAQLVAGGCPRDLEEKLFAELRKHKDTLSQPFVYRSREDTVDLSGLARHVQAEHLRLASEPMVRVVDQVSRTLRLHQHDCCKLVERALGLTSNLTDLPQKCAAMYYRECHFVALSLHDMAQGLGQLPQPDRCSVAFFGMLGGHKVLGSLCKSLGLLLRDLATERSGDDVFAAHASAMIQLLVETLFAWCFIFKALPSEVEEVLALLPHVVVSQHAPLGQGFTVSDLDLILREEHNDISMKLCLALFCMMCPQLGDGQQLDISKLPETVTPATVRDFDLTPIQDANSFDSSQLGAKVKASKVGDYWNVDNPLGQFLCFAVNGLMFQDETALRRSYTDWHMPHFILHEILLSGSLVTESCSSQLVLRCIHDLFAMALLPVGRGWIAIRKLDTQADALQISVLQCLNRLLRAYPPACGTFRDVAVHCTDTFHLHSPGATAVLDEGGPPSRQLPWFGAPVLADSGVMSRSRIRHDNTPLYAEILSLLATICARGTLGCARVVCQKLVSHSNQWFNWSFLMDSLAQTARAPMQGGSVGASTPGTNSVLVALCHLVSAACSCRLWVSQPPPQATIQALQSNLSSAAMLAEGFGTLLTDLLGTHTDLAVKAACLGALAHIDFSPVAAKGAFAALTAVLPVLLVGISDTRNCADGALAIELLTCALHLAQAVPLSKGRYTLDLQPLTHVVIHHILMKVLADSSQFHTTARYWRLASLTMRWLRLVLRGPLPLGGSMALNSALVQFYADSESSASEIAMQSCAGNATAYVFRCMLSLDSPAFARVLYLLLLRGVGLDGMSDRRRGCVARPFMELTVHVGLDVVRLLAQRDVLFCRLYGQHAADRAAGPGVAQSDAGGLQLVHRLLFAEFGFAYPASGEDVPTRVALNPFANRRLWQSAPVSRAAVGLGSGRPNPSYFSLLLEFTGAQVSPEICKLALYTFAQCSLRDPAMVLRILQLEPWRLQALCTDLYNRMARPEEDSTMATAVAGPHGKWDARAEVQFMFEGAEKDLPLDGACYLDATSFKTGLTVCGAVDVICQLADDAVVQAADLLSWACCRCTASSDGASFAGGAVADTWQFQAAYLRGFDVRGEWLGPEAAENAVVVPPPVLASISCRALLLRTMVLLMGGTGAQPMGIAAPRLAQVLLGLDPDGAYVTGRVDVDLHRAGQPSLLDAVMELLENPPPISVQTESGELRRPHCKPLRDSISCASLPLSVEQQASYEALLGIMVSLFATPALRDVALRHVAYAWPSRFQTLRTLLGLPWANIPLLLRRVLVSQTALLLQAVTWEMRIAHPSSAQQPRSQDSRSVAGHQRAEMKRAMAEYLQEVVRDLCVPSDFHEVGHSRPPFLVAVALRLLDACDGFGGPAASDRRAMPTELQSVLSAASCKCAALADDGSLALCLELADPFVFQRLCGLGGQTSGSWGSLCRLGDVEQRRVYDACEQLSRANGAACTRVLTKAVMRTFTLFLSAVFYHFVEDSRPSRNRADPRSQCARAHLEALLPRFEDSVTAAAAQPRLEFLSGLAVVLVQTLQRVELTLPDAALRGLFGVLARVALHPAGSAETRASAYQALLTVLQRMVPDIDTSRKYIIKADVAALRVFVSSVARAACMAKNALAGWQSGVEIMLALLSALFLRVPLAQLDEVCSGADLWQHFAGLLDVAPGDAAVTGAAEEAAAPRCQAAQVAAVLCQRPALATAFFERGCLTAVLHKDFLHLPRAHLASAGLSSLDVTHAGALLAALEVVVAVAKSLPAHQLALSSIVEWVERNQRLISEVVHWVMRLPLATAMEPGAVHLQGLAPGFQVVAPPTVDTFSATSKQLLVCSSMVDDVTTAAAAGFFVGRLRGIGAEGLAGSMGLGGGGEGSPPQGLGSAAPTAAQLERGHGAVAVYYRCSALFVELWSLLQARAAGTRDTLSVRIRNLEAPLAGVTYPLLAHMSVLMHPRRRARAPGFPEQPPAPASGLAARGRPGAAAAMAAAEAAMRGPDDMETDAVRTEVYPSETTRLATCLHVLQSWRYDSVSLAIAGAAGGGPLSADGDSVMEGYGRFSQERRAAAEFAAIAGPRYTQELLVQIRSRASILCLVFVHCCSEVLNVRPVAAAAAGEGQGAKPPLAFAGSLLQYSMLLSIVEVSLQLLYTHLSVLKVAAEEGTGMAAWAAGAAVGTGSAGMPRASATPRLALVIQSLRLLRQLAASIGGSLVAVEADWQQPLPLQAAQTAAAPTKDLDMTFAACLAERLEEMMLELQSI